MVSRSENDAVVGLGPDAKAHSNDVFVQILKTAHLISQGYSGTIMVPLVPKDEGHVALMELSKWRLEGLDQLYAQAVQVRQWDNLIVEVASSEN
ncbi:hypothetical protein PHJA_000914100 [Phtheirospermum japonicum]|uniref:Uncharacterized protein n=1 Tax=Phtheirospermum japonicum TaxID=374723 RepID=A0A830BTE1_9LAMI|nr:hypothetical protein PHJA_000914100 [Phtheirospermum japonicum]